MTWASPSSIKLFCREESISKKGRQGSLEEGERKDKEQANHEWWRVQWLILGEHRRTEDNNEEGREEIGFFLCLCLEKPPRPDEAPGRRKVLPSIMNSVVISLVYIHFVIIDIDRCSYVHMCSCVCLCVSVQHGASGVKTLKYVRININTVCLCVRTYVCTHEYISVCA